MGLKENFRTILIEIPDDIKTEEKELASLNSGWQEYSQYPYTQGIGDQWGKRGSSAVLKVPSAIIPEEHSYLINPLNKDFSRIKNLGDEPFDFDRRIKAPTM